jgi:diaminopimelate decarboxylase
VKIPQTPGIRSSISISAVASVNYLRDRTQADQLPSTSATCSARTWNLPRFCGDFVGPPVSAARRTSSRSRDNPAEPGRSVISDAGLVSCRAQHQTTAGDRGLWLLTDAGYNLMLSMNNYKWYYHLISASRAGEAYERDYKVAGPLCDSGDVYFDIEREGRLPDYRKLPENVQPGEVLALLNSGAYSLAQMFHYNGRPLPATVMIGEDGETKLIRRR